MARRPPCNPPRRGSEIEKRAATLRQLELNFEHDSEILRLAPSRRPVPPRLRGRTQQVLFPRWAGQLPEWTRRGLRLVATRWVTWQNLSRSLKLVRAAAGSARSQLPLRQRQRLRRTPPALVVPCAPRPLPQMLHFLRHPSVVRAQAALRAAASRRDARPRRRASSRTPSCSATRVTLTPTALLRADRRDPKWWLLLRRDSPGASA